VDRIGRYKIVRELGRGAMGVVYHAIDPNIGRPVAIKTIYLGQRKPEEHDRLKERLFREARSAGILSHPGIVTIYDVEQQGDLAYIAMEYVDGPTLDHLLARPQAIPPAEMFSILAQTAAALDYAHQKGIIHRDIKPANLMITADGTAKITDFGIAKVTTSEQFTMTGAIVGTPHYMSPEQVQGQPTVDGRSDQFSLAVIAFEMLTGEKPYTGEHLTTVVYKIVAEEPAAPARLNPSLGSGIDAVIRKALSKRPDARYATCQEFIDALEKACAATKGWKTMPRGGSLSEPTLADAAPARPAVNLPPARRRVEAGATAERDPQRKGGFLTFLLAMLVAAGLLALIGWQAAPYLFPKPAATASESAKAPAEPSETKAAPALPPQSAPAPVPTPVAGEPKADDDRKPSPIPSEPSEPKQQPSGGRPAPARAATLQPVEIISSPSGATATLDGRPDSSCTTPCPLQASPGRHTVSVALNGYNTEIREVDVGSAPVEMPAVVLRTPGGTLMLSSDPPGASIVVDGKRFEKLTPTPIPLPAGTHKITVEKDGHQASHNVEVGNGLVSLKLILGQ
jgi:serine/threonine-protein kinase